MKTNNPATLLDGIVDDPTRGDVLSGDCYKVKVTGRQGGYVQYVISSGSDKKSHNVSLAVWKHEVRRILYGVK